MDWSPPPAEPWEPGEREGGRDRRGRETGEGERQERERDRRGRHTESEIQREERDREIKRVCQIGRESCRERV